MSAAQQGVRILGIDPGSRITGFGVIDFCDNHARHVASGCIQIRETETGPRLTRIFDGVGELVAQYAPAEIAIEQVFMHRNAGSALKLGHARAAALLAGVTRGLVLYEYTPNAVKLAVTGRGHAAKEQIQHMIKVLLTLPELPQSDAADALAVAICHGHTRETLERRRRAEQAVSGAGS